MRSSCDAEGKRNWAAGSQAKELVVVPPRHPAAHALHHRMGPWALGAALREAQSGCPGLQNPAAGSNRSSSNQNRKLHGSPPPHVLRSSLPLLASGASCCRLASSQLCGLTRSPCHCRDCASDLDGLGAPTPPCAPPAQLLACSSRSRRAVGHLRPRRAKLLSSAEPAIPLVAKQPSHAALPCGRRRSVLACCQQENGSGGGSGGGGSGLRPEP